MQRVIPIVIAAMAIVTFPAVAGSQERAIPACNGSPATLWGTSGDDILIGTDGDDVIVGRGGNDTIRGLAGNDTICGGAGDDLLFGGSGDDVIKGGTGNDEILGGTGDDLISGWTGSDTLDGGGGADRVLGHAGDDQLSGGNHDDILRGGSGHDVAVGEAGVDECRSEETRVCELVALSEGDDGWAVRFLQRALRDRKLYRGAIDGVFDRDVAIAVATFHKVTGPAYSDPNTAVERWQANPPSERMAVVDWDRLLAFQPAPPKVREGQPDRVETDIGHQVLYLILGDEVDAIVHVSTGYRPTATPRTTGLRNGGYFWYEHPYDGWSPKPGAWSIYQFWAYRAGSQYNYGVHGYLSVPYWPASHGCTRVEVWEADYLNELFFIGMPVHVWDN
jgi:lipoprotein-anchoring transpeptidase ErfK/SrfK